MKARVRRVLRRLLGITYSPSLEAQKAMAQVDWPAILQPPTQEARARWLDDVEAGARKIAAVGVPTQVAGERLQRRLQEGWYAAQHYAIPYRFMAGVDRPEADAGGPTGDRHGTPDDGDDTLTDGVTPHDTHSGEQETTTMDQTDPSREDTYATPNYRPHPSTLEAWAEDEWTRDTIRLVLRGQVAGVGPVYAVPQQIDRQPVSLDLWVEPTEPGAEWEGDQPGLRLQREAALAIARAIIRTVEGTEHGAALTDARHANDLLERELQEARQAAIVAALERDGAMSVAGAYLEHREAVEARLKDRTQWHQETAARLAVHENPQRWITGTLDETAETWTGGPEAGRLWAVPAPEPDWAGIVRVCKDTDTPVEIAGVRIAPCDDHGRTAEVRALEAELVEVRRQRDRSEQIAQERGEALDHRDGLELDAKVAGYADAANDLTNHAGAMRVDASWVENPYAAVLDLVNGIRSHAGLPTLAELPDGSGERWTTVVGDTWVKRAGWDNGVEGEGARWFLVETTGDDRRLGAAHYIVEGEAITPEDLDHTATAWVRRPQMED